MTKEAFKKCFNVYFDPIRKYLYYRCGDAELSTDIAQEAFMKIWEKQIEFQEPGTKSLLYKIAGDLLISHFRKNKVAEKYISSLDFNLKASSPEESLNYQELKTNYEKVLVDLPESQRTVFLMSRMEGMTYREIAERLELSVKAIEKRMSNALATLKKQLGHHVK